MFDNEICGCEIVLGVELLYKLSLISIVGMGSSGSSFGEKAQVLFKGI